MLLTKKPILCNYYLTYRCNAKCSFCDIWEKPSPYVTVENVKQNLRDLKKLGVKVIDFTGGEPLLHRNLHKLLSLAKEFGFITTVTTNCLLYPKRAESLKGLIDMLHFSLDSPNEEEHNESRGVKCYDKVVESIAVAKSLGERPDIIFTVHDQNIDQIKEVYEKFCKPNGTWLILNPIFSYNEVGESISKENLKELETWAKKPMVYLNNAFLELRKQGGNDINNPSCKAATSTVVISPENNLILPCYHLNKEEIPIRDNLFEIHKYDYRVEKAKEMQGKLPECEGCTINCYFQPSFAVNLNKYWLKALPSTIKYSIGKGTWKELVK